MESLFASNEDFFEGDVFTPVEEEYLHIRESRQGGRSGAWLKRIGVAATARKILVGSAVGAVTALMISFSASMISAATPAWSIEAVVPPDSIPDSQEFKTARESLGMSQRKAAAVLHVSESALEQFEQDRAKPGRAFSARYQAVIDLDRLLANAFGRNSNLKNAYLYGDGAFFGGKPPLEWAQASERPDAINEILAIYSRALS